MSVHIIVYITVINIIAFFLFGIDKLKARMSRWRVSEAALLAMAVLGGSVGAFAGMHIWHHKTLHKKFRYGIPATIILHIAAAIWLAVK